MAVIKKALLFKVHPDWIGDKTIDCTPLNMKDGDNCFVLLSKNAANIDFIL